MTSPRPHDTLQTLYDGELTDGEAAELRASVGDEDRAVLMGLARLSEVVRAGAGAAEEDIAGESDALFGRIHAEIKATPQPRLSVIQGERRARGGAVAFVGLAIAAAVALAFFLRPVDTRIATPEDPEAPAAPAPAEHVLEAPQGTEVVQVDFGQHTGTYFEVPGDRGQPLAVVWIDEGAEALQ